jgi:hypothetical protein
MRKEEMNFYQKTGDEGKDGEHLPLHVQYQEIFT